jgi:hypothetical protein
MLKCAEHKLLCREVSELAKLWRPFSGATLDIFQCRLLYWVFEAKQNIVESVRDIFYVLLIYF